MRILLLAALAMLPLTAPANAATTWYILNTGAGQCQNAAEQARKMHVPEFASPAALQSYLREDSTFRDMHIYRDSEGQITGVTVTNTDDVAILFFSSQDNCKAGLQRAIDQGQLANPEELK